MQKPRDSDTDAWHALGMHRLCGELTLTDNQREVANIIEESGQVLLQSIDDILDYSKLTSGNFSISSHAVCVASIITSVVRSVQTTLRPSVHFQVFLDQSLPSTAQGDPLRYRQIAQNVISNATKFIEKGLLCVRVSSQQEEEDSYGIIIKVTDAGIGSSDDVARGSSTRPPNSIVPRESDTRARASA